VIDRRRWLATLGAIVLITPHRTSAQPSGRIPRIGFVEAGSRSANQHFLDAFLQGLRDLKYVEGQTIAVEDRWAEGQPDRFPGLIRELIASKVDLLVVASTPGVVAAKSITSTVPVVFWGVADPIGIGVVTSLRHPGGNITGVALGTEDGLTGKWIEILSQAVPGLTSLAVLWNPDSVALEARIKELRASAATLKLKDHTFTARSVDDFDGAFNVMSKTRVGGLVVVVDPLTLRYRHAIVRLAAQHRLPAVYGFSEFVRSGGLIAYGPSVPDQARRAARYVDKILTGARPADLPVEQPTKFELLINLRTARALGLTIPQSLLLRADELIQ
jgi:putative tryptophan/tyrosine transport system substrate-binding protein